MTPVDETDLVDHFTGKQQNNGAFTLKVCCYLTSGGSVGISCSASNYGSSCNVSDAPEAVLTP